MISWLPKKKYTPIGIDVGSRSVKLIQFTADAASIVDATRWEIPAAKEDEEAAGKIARIGDAIAAAMNGRGFRGRDAIVCLSGRDLFLQNLRVPKLPSDELERVVQQEAAGRLPYSVTDAEIRFLETADVRSGDATLREVILLCSQRESIEQTIQIVERAKLHPLAIDAEPVSLLRAHCKQFRRDADYEQRWMFVHIGYEKTIVVISEGQHVLFIKYLDIAGRQFDQAVARHLEMAPEEASALRRHNGDRRSDQQDPEVSRSLEEATRGVMEKLADELSRCVRYHSVTFRGRPLSRLVLGGGEGSETLVGSLARRLDIRCEVGDPLRSYETNIKADRHGVWDVAAGLALKEVDG
jgi:type IV pilus assembly protein PilM